MNKRKIYSKLLEYVDVTKWRVVTDGGDEFLANHTYDNNNVIAFEQKNLGWFFKIKKNYRSYSDHEYSDQFSCLVTLNGLGKFIFAASFFIISLFIYLFGSRTIPFYQFFLFDLTIGIILSYFFISIFRWKIYMKLRQALNYVNNEDKRMEEEENEKLNQQIVDIINSKNPQLLRKEKLKKIGL